MILIWVHIKLFELGSRYDHLILIQGTNGMLSTTKVHLGAMRCLKGLQQGRTVVLVTRFDLDARFRFSFNAARPEDLSCDWHLEKLPIQSKSKVTSVNILESFPVLI